jgi:beta-galactosidase
MPNSKQSNKPVSATRLHLGAAYYPEHWPEERWPEDIRLMKEAALTVVRMAEFAWSTMEPSAGKFNFAWLERAIEKLATAGIVSVLGTPTAAPPAWLVEKHPDLLAVDENGRRVQFGNRCHYCVISPEFHDAILRIVQAMGKYFGSNPNVIGWQIDNEYNRVCYCDRCRRLFQQFLADKYGSLDVLNQRWTTAYWSQTYSAWEQIPLPIGPHNPALMLEFKHFITESYRKFQRLQLDILRPHLKPGVWTTHNLMNWYDGYDHYIMTEDLDLASWDWYVATGHHDYLSSGAVHDMTRGFKRRNFWLIETQPGNVNWASLNNTLNKGEARAMAWHAVAHGADAVCYWQWRSPLGGQEQYHGTLVDQSGQPRLFYEEAQQLGREFSALSDLLAGSEVKARVAMLNCYDSRWSIQWQRHHGDFDYVAHFNNYYRPLAARNLNVDVISADEPLDGYKLVIAPSLLILKEKSVTQLKEFVRRGGYLVLTLRTGMKDEFNALLPVRQPGPLAELAGLEVEDYYALLNPIPIKGNLFDGTAKLWAERLKVLDAKLTIPAARYGAANGWLDGEVAIAVHPFGKGMVYYVGAYLDEASQQVLMDHILTTAGIHGMKTPAGIEVRTRQSRAGEEIYFVINHVRTEQTFRLPWPAREHLNQQEIIGELKLPPYGVAILTRAAGVSSAP